MAIKTGAQYIESLRKVKTVLYINGEKVENFVDHPLIKPSLNSVALVYDLANDPQYEELMTATSHLTGEKINLYTHIPHSREDLIKRVLSIRVLQQKSGGACIMRHNDTLVPPYSVTYEMDKKLGTEYHTRYRNFLTLAQREDLMINHSVSDPKGNRKLRPHQQVDPDLYLRVVEKKSDGIIVRGAKLHQTAAAIAHFKLVFPTRTMTEKDKDYTVAFAVENDAKGVINVMSKSPCDERWCHGLPMDVGNAKFASHTGIVFYDNVFIPWERVFMCGEYEFTTLLLRRFGDQHRASYGGCRAGWCDVVTGAAANIAEYNGLGEDRVIREKLNTMMAMGESMFCYGYTAAALGYPTPSGAYHPHPVYSNVCKLNISKYPYEIVRIALDIAGGLLFTMPSEKDFRHPDLRDRFSKYLKGVDNVSADTRLRAFGLLFNMVGGTHGVEFLSMCPSAAGPPEGAKMELMREIDWGEKKRFAKIAAGIEEIEK